jgi:para-aminobenzoate synthetase component 1
MSVTWQHLQAPAEPTQPLVEELTPTPDPWDVARRLARRGGLLFLDSAAQDSPFARYSYVMAGPDVFVGGHADRYAADPLAKVADVLKRFPARTVPGLPPFQGGAAGLFGYGLSHYLERISWPRFNEFALPHLCVGIYNWVVAFDHWQRRAWLVVHKWPTRAPFRRFLSAARRIRTIKNWLQAEPLAELPRDWCLDLLATQLCPQYPLPGRPGLTSNFDRPGYLAAVRRAIDYIHAGDCFQVNLAQRLLAPAPENVLDLYRRLRERNPAAFAGLFCPAAGVVIASASPERFLRVDNGEVEARPIKGTRPRGRTPAEDDALRRELLASAKDRAENVMIVDLMRNDLGRVCEYGSVRVPAVCRVESQPYVHHLVSEVRGRLRPGLGPVDLLRAAFPGGSVTGAPKVRAMQIIAELEPTARGPYCGSLGYIGFDGSMDTSILIRTFTIARGWMQFPVGGGIVADSDPQREYEETWHKAEGLLRALR